MVKRPAAEETTNQGGLGRRREADDQVVEDGAAASIWRFSHPGQSRNCTYLSESAALLVASAAAFTSTRTFSGVPLVLRKEAEATLTWGATRRTHPYERGVTQPHTGVVGVSSVVPYVELVLTSAASWSLGDEDL